ncbi:hypothetical protein DFAR_2210081 [Desulfarculales bacterium]
MDDIRKAEAKERNLPKAPAGLYSRPLTAAG